LSRVILLSGSQNIMCRAACQTLTHFAASICGDSPSGSRKRDNSFLGLSLGLYCCTSRDGRLSGERAGRCLVDCADDLGPRGRLLLTCATLRSLGSCKAGVWAARVGRGICVHWLAGLLSVKGGSRFWAGGCAASEEIQARSLRDRAVGSRSCQVLLKSFRAPLADLVSISAYAPSTSAVEPRRVAPPTTNSRGSAGEVWVFVCSNCAGCVGRPG